MGLWTNLHDTDDTTTVPPELFARMAAAQPCLAGNHCMSIVFNPFQLEHWSCYTARLHLHLRSDKQAVMLAADLSQLLHLTELQFVDARAEGLPRSHPPLLPGLWQLPGLAQALCTGGVPAEVWRCPHLSRLEIADAQQQAARLPALGASCTALYELRLARCPPATRAAVMCTLGPAASSLRALRMGASVGAAVAAASHLTALTHLDCGVDFGAAQPREKAVALPASFCQLRRLQPLNLGGVPLLDVAALHSLQLTCLNLSGCGLRSLPGGRYLGSLKV